MSYVKNGSRGGPICSVLLPLHYPFGHLRLLLIPFLLLLSGCLVSGAPPERSVERVAGQTGISGEVTDRQGLPASGAYVYAYRSASSGLRGPADFEAAVDLEGGYFLDLSEGLYYLVARKRSSGTGTGPPRPGDAWAIYPGNPVEVVEGFATRADLSLAVTGRPMLGRQGENARKNAILSGLVTDAGGEPVEGLFVLAYRDPEFKGSPAFISPPTDRAGRFTLPVEGPAAYCLVVRSKIRGQVSPGEFYGVLEKEGCRTVVSGEAKDVGRVVVSPLKELP